MALSIAIYSFRNLNWENHLFIHIKITVINPLHGNINNYIFPNTNDQWENWHCFYIFANLSNVRLNRRQLDSCICFCIQSVVMSHVVLSPAKKSLCNYERKESRKDKHILVLLWEEFWSCGSQKGSQGPLWALDHAVWSTALESPELCPHVTLLLNTALPTRDQLLDPVSCSPKAGYILMLELFLGGGSFPTPKSWKKLIVLFPESLPCIGVGPQKWLGPPTNSGSVTSAKLPYTVHRGRKQPIETSKQIQKRYSQFPVRGREWLTQTSTSCGMGLRNGGAALEWGCIQNACARKVSW